MIRVGIGGWTFAPWRGVFYPKGLPHARELAYASGQLTTIEINGTFYRSQSPQSFAKWRDETPDDFVFAVKSHRSIVNRSKLADSAEAIDWFFKSGVVELGPKLGPLLWQMPHFKRFDADDVATFLSLLPRSLNGRAISHAFEPRHESFKDPRFVEIARDAGVSIVLADSAKYPCVADLSGDVVYARLQNATAEEETGYPGSELDRWAERSRHLAKGLPAEGMELLAAPDAARERNVFVYMINGAKERAPAAAMALLTRLGEAR